jgi:hypothetical protein
MENNQIDEGRRGLGRFIFNGPDPRLTLKQKLGAALGGAAITATTVGGAYAGKVAADAIRDPANNPQLLEPLTYDDGTPMKRKGGKPVTSMDQTYALTVPAGSLAGFGTGLGLFAAAVANRRRNSSPSQPLKEYYKETLTEAILATNTSRQTQTRIRAARGIDSDGDHPNVNLQDPYNRARLRNMTPQKAAARESAFEKALNTAMEVEFIPQKHR